MASVGLERGMRVLDAGCGSGDALQWLDECVGPGGQVIGFDLAGAHVRASRSIAPPHVAVVQASMLHAPLAPAKLDLIWCANTLHHLRDPLEGLRSLAALLRLGGRIAVGQSSFLPEMYLAWDSRLEDAVATAVRAYYRERYGVSATQLTSLRALVGSLRKARYEQVHARTYVIERVQPLSDADRRYLHEAIFRDTWGERLRPYLSGADYATLQELCDPQRPGFALHREDFHFLQTFTLVIGTRPPHV